MRNENLLIFGDSYSTYYGYIPEGYATYYPRGGAWDIEDVSHTWWAMLAEETDSRIVMNNSWSGSTICNTGYNGDCSTTSSFIHRLEELIENGFFEKNKIDRILVFGGTNDSWTGNTCGELKFSDWTDADRKQILPGISYFLHTMQRVLPRENIHVIINSELRAEVMQGIAAICQHEQIPYTQIADVEKIEGHPTYLGMKQIKDQILNKIG